VRRQRKVVIISRTRILHFDRVERLVRRARTGDENALRELLEAHRQAVTSTLVACGVRCPETASDLAQEVAVRAWRNLDRLQDPRSFTAWIRRVAANAARDHLRRVAVRKEEALDTAVDLAAEDDPHERAERVAELRLMLAAIEEEDEDTVTLLMARVDGVPVAVLAEREGISQGALKMRMMRVRKRLRDRLAQLRAGPPGGEA
jgi:RNA polymerase sigma factor (sigma-70 family)